MSPPTGIRFGRRASSSPLPAHLRALLSTALVAGALLGGALWWTAGDDATGDTTRVVGESEGGRLLVRLDRVDVGGLQGSGFRWFALDAAANDVDTGFGQVLMGAGPVPSGPLTDARFVFAQAGVVEDGALHVLSMPQDMLQLRVPGPAGGPGDTLRVVFDVERSVQQVGHVRVFAPFVSHAEWVRASDAASGAEGGADGPGGDAGVVEPFQSRGNATDIARGGGGGAGPRGPGGPGGGGSGGPGGPGGPGAGAGSVSLFVRDLSAAHVRHLNVTFAKVGVGPVGGGPGDARTYYQGGAVIDVRAYDGPDDRALLTSFQMPAGTYGSLHFEFGASQAVVLQSPHELRVPQPRLVVEVPFTVVAGERVELLVDFSVSESLVASGDGWEFRPVVSQFQRSSDDTDGDGVHDVADPDDDNDGDPDMQDPDRDGDMRPDAKPQQYRLGGAALPSIGHAQQGFVKDTTGADPEATAGLGGDEPTRPVGSEGSATDPSGLLPDDEVPPLPDVDPLPEP